MLLQFGSTSHFSSNPKQVYSSAHSILPYDDLDTHVHLKVPFSKHLYTVEHKEIRSKSLSLLWRLGNFLWDCVFNNRSYTQKVSPNWLLKCEFKKNDTHGHAILDREKSMRSQCYTKSCNQMKKARSWRGVLLHGRS